MHTCTSSREHTLAAHVRMRKSRAARVYGHKWLCQRLQISFGDKDKRKSSRTKIIFYFTTFPPSPASHHSLPLLLSDSLFFTFSSPAFSSLSPFFDLELRNLSSERWQSFKYACSRSTWGTHATTSTTAFRQPLSLMSVCLLVDQPQHKFAVDLS